MLQNTPESVCPRVWGLQFYLKNEDPAQAFSGEFCRTFRNAYFK